MSSQVALTALARAASEAVAGALEGVAAGQVQAGDVAVLEPGAGPLAGIPYPAVAADAALADGAVVFAMTLEGARRLAAAEAGTAPPEPGAGPAAELAEPEAAALSEAMGRTLAAIAGAVSALIDTDVQAGAPRTRTFVSEAETEGAHPSAPHAVRAAFSVCGEPCRLVLLVPSTLVARVDRALDDPEPVSGPALLASDKPHGAPSLAGIEVRVWAELGRASMPTADVVGLPHGAVVELDRAPDDPIDLFVNGRRFATGRLVVVDGDWAVRIESVLPASPDGAAELPLA